MRDADYSYEYSLDEPEEPKVIGAIVLGFAGWLWSVIAVVAFIVAILAIV